jgi:DNA polymerase I
MSEAFSDLFENEDSSEVPPEGDKVSVVKPKLTYEDFPAEDLYTYAGIDCIATSGLLAKLLPMASEETVGKGLDEAGKTVIERFPAVIEGYLNVVAPAMDFIEDLEINGMRYSVDRNKFYDKRMEAEVNELDDRIFSSIGKKVDLNSGQAMAKFLYGERGFTPPSVTKSGEPSTDGEALLVLAGLDPLGGKYVAKDSSLQFLADMAKRKDINSVRNTFVKNYVKDFVKRDGKVHPSYLLHGTSSFRISGVDPNLTQLPRPKHGYNVRDCFTVGEGNILICADFSSCEVKILANLSKEDAMLQAIADGLDFHSFSASAMYRIPYAEFISVIKDHTHALHKDYKGKRQLSKVLTFSLLYGSSVNGIAMQLYIVAEEAQRLVDLYFNTFPKVKVFIEKTHFYAKHNQFIMTALGQKKNQFGTNSCFRYTAAYNAGLRNSQNVAIQSSASSIGLITFAELNNQVKKYGANSVCSVYDSIEIECPISNAAKVIALTAGILDNFPLQRFPKFMQLPIGNDIEVGESWGKLEPVKPDVSQEEVLHTLESTRAEALSVFC